MKFYTSALLLIISVFLVSCADDEVKKTKSGYFKLAQVQSPSAKSATTSEVNETSFDLGIIKASREFYFVLANGGENDITNIELTTNNPAFVISPASISLLPAAGSDAEALIPLVSLGIEHGPKLNGVGYTALLPMGVNTATLTITGTTVENGESLELESTFTVTIDASVMDVTLYTDGEEIDYSDPISQYSGFEFESGLPAIPGFEINPEDFEIKNTGNVDVILWLVDATTVDNQTTQVTLSPDETKTITLPTPATDYYLHLIKVDGAGTVSDRARIKQGVDGKGYFFVQHNMNNGG